MKTEKVLKYLFTGIGIGGIVLMAMGVGIYLGLDPAPAHVSEGAQASVIEGSTLEGDVISTASYEGDVVVLNFWATWCGPCVQSLPGKNELARKYEDQGVHVIGVSGDFQEADLESFLADNETSFPTIYENAQTIFQEWEVVRLPTVIIIDQTGKVAYRGMGNNLENEIEKLL